MAFADPKLDLELDFIRAKSAYCSQPHFKIEIAVHVLRVPRRRKAQARGNAWRLVGVASRLRRERLRAPRHRKGAKSESRKRKAHRMPSHTSSALARSVAVLPPSTEKMDGFSSLVYLL